MTFVQERVGGNYSFSTSTNRAAEPEVDWEQFHVDPAFHKLCPRRLKNGALVHIDGCPTVGKVGKTYALWRKEAPGLTKYIGHYKVVENITMPFTIWQREFSTDQKKLI